MAKAPKFKAIKTPKGWRMSIPPKFSGGTRQQYFFKTQALADEFAKKFKDQREEFGAQAKSISPALAEMAVSAAARLAPFGVTITDLVNRFVEAETRNRASVPVEEALEAFKAAKEERSDSAKAGYKMMADRFAEDFTGRSLASITDTDIAGHIERHTNGKSGFNLRLRLISAFVRWSSKPPRTWCNAEIVKHVEKQETISGHIGTLTAAQCKAIMSAAELHFPECVPAFAIGLFTGIRQKEIARLEPKDITADGITVPAISSKTKRRRFVAMQKPLAAWLKAYPIGDTVIPANWTRKEKAVRRLAGWKVWSDLVPTMALEPPMEAEPPEDAPDWIDNGLRHTAATVALALGKPIERLVFEHGHSGGLNVLKNHYIGHMNKEQALAIWTIGPKGTKLPVFKVA